MLPGYRACADLTNEMSEDCGPGRWGRVGFTDIEEDDDGGFIIHSATSFMKDGEVVTHRKIIEAGVETYTIEQGGITLYREVDGKPI